MNQKPEAENSGFLSHPPTPSGFGRASNKISVLIPYAECVFGRLSNTFLFPAFCRLLLLIFL